MLGPIFNREVLTVPRRNRHYITRSAFLLVLWVLAFTTWQATFGWGREVTQGDLAYFGGLLFQLLCFLQLTLVLFFSALFAASAITQEKDRRTFVLLLLTDLRDYEIVLGKLMGSLLHIGVMVVSAIPVLALLMLLGGVSMKQVLLVFLVLAASALAAGSLGGLLALWREKTFQSLALTVLALVLYLLLIEGSASLLEWTSEAAVSTLDAISFFRISFNPFRAMQSVLEPRPEAEATGGGAYSFAAIMLGFAAALNLIGIWKLRLWNPSGEPIMQAEPDEEDRAAQGAPARDVHASPGAPRPVWANPVLWREIRTRAYGRKPLLVKAAFLLVFGLVCFWVYQTTPPPGAAERLTPAWGLVPIAQLSLLLVAAQALTSITSERDLKALELLLVTDLSPREFIFGKLGGIFYNAKEVILAPLLLALAYGWFGYIRWEPLLYLFITLVVLILFTAALGLHVALRTDNTRLAIGAGLGTVFFLFVGTLICMFLILISGRFEYQWTSFVIFLAAGIGGMLWVLGMGHSSSAISIASFTCPLGIFYTLTGILIGNPQTGESGDPLLPFLVMTSAFGFTIAAMLVPLLSEFHVALGYTTPGEE